MKKFIINSKRKYGLTTFQYHAILAFCETYWEPENSAELRFLIGMTKTESKNFCFWDHWDLEELKKCYHIDRNSVQTKYGVIYANPKKVREEMEQVLEARLNIFYKQIEQAKKDKMNAEAIERLASDLNLIRFVSVSQKGQLMLGGYDFFSTFDTESSGGTSFVIVDDKREIDVSRMHFKARMSCRNTHIFYSDDDIKHCYSLTGGYNMYSLCGVVVFQKIE